MKTLASIILCISLFLVCIDNTKERTPQRPYIDLPEGISEAKPGTLLYVDYSTPDTISIAFDNMDDLISLWQNDSGDSVWVDLQTMAIYNSRRREEMTFTDKKDLVRGLLLELNN